MTKNKTAVITGAAQGIGKGIALAFAKEGYNVVVSDINMKDCKKTAKEIGDNSLVIKCDVSKKTEVDNLIKTASQRFKKIDVLVNNVGIFPFVSFNKMEEKDWDKVLNINLKSIFFTSKAVLKSMPSGGRIVNISSIASIVGFEGLVHYCASKAGMNGMTRALALELIPKKITVNAVAPGAIDTPGAASAMDEKGQKADNRCYSYGKIRPARRYC